MKLWFTPVQGIVVFHDHIPDRVHVLFNLLHANQEVSSDVLHDLDEASEDLLFSVKHLEKGCAEIRHALAVPHRWVHHRISCEHTLQLCNTDIATLRSQRKALGLRREAV